MTVVPHELHRIAPEARGWRDFPIAEVAASITISVIWLTVLLDSLFGPDIVNESAAPGTRSVVPSAVVVAFFAVIATWVIAKYAFRRDQRRDE
jgi:hypothetical protein